MEVSVVHLGPPVPKGRPRMGKGVTYTPRATEEAEMALRWSMRLARKRDWLYSAEAFYALEARFFFPTFRRIDSDNALKLSLDAGNECWWPDDAQVVETHCYVVRGDPNPRTELRAWVVDNPHRVKK